VLRVFGAAWTTVLIWGQPSPGGGAVADMVGPQEDIAVLLAGLLRLRRAWSARGAFEGAVYALGLAVGRRVGGCGQAMGDGGFNADPCKAGCGGSWIPFAVSELAGIIGPPGGDCGGHDGDAVTPAWCRAGFEGLREQLGIGALAGTVDGDDQGEPASGCGRQRCKAGRVRPTNSHPVAAA
jgi:hypothetical protein